MRIYLRNAVAALADMLWKGTDGAAHVLEQGNIAGLVNPSSPTNAWVPVSKRTNSTTITPTVSATMIGGGAANDTMLRSIIIRARGAGAVTVTVTGFANQAGVATNRIFTGSTTADVVVPFEDALNSAGALTVQPSVADFVDVQWRPV